MPRPERPIEPPFVAAVLLADPDLRCVRSAVARILEFRWDEVLWYSLRRPDGANRKRVDGAKENSGRCRGTVMKNSDLVTPSEFVPTGE